MQRPLVGLLALLLLQAAQAYYLPGTCESLFFASPEKSGAQFRSRNGPPAPALCRLQTPRSSARATPSRVRAPASGAGPLGRAEAVIGRHDRACPARPRAPAHAVHLHLTPCSRGQLPGVV